MQPVKKLLYCNKVDTISCWVQYTKTQLAWVYWTMGTPWWSRNLKSWPGLKDYWGWPQAMCLYTAIPFLCMNRPLHDDETYSMTMGCTGMKLYQEAEYPVSWVWEVYFLEGIVHPPSRSCKQLVPMVLEERNWRPCQRQLIWTCQCASASTF